MTEDNTPRPEPITLPLMPAAIEFNIQLLEQWVAIPQGHRIAAPLTRQDLDFLLFGLLRICEGQQAIDQVITLWSNGNAEEANKKLLEMRRLNTEAQNNIRQFFTGLIASALRERANAK